MQPRIDHRQIRPAHLVPEARVLDQLPEHVLGFRRPDEFQGEVPPLEGQVKVFLGLLVESFEALVRVLGQLLEALVDLSQPGIADEDEAHLGEAFGQAVSFRSQVVTGRLK